MPFVYDFATSLSDTMSVDVCPKGWVNPITVEYIVAQAHRYDTTLSIVWRIKGTTHCFTIGEQRLNVLSNGDYKTHFTTVLENFRQDYLSWFSDPDYENAEWREEYRQQYGDLIIEEDNDNESKSK